MKRPRQKCMVRNHACEGLLCRRGGPNRRRHCARRGGSSARGDTTEDNVATVVFLAGVPNPKFASEWSAPFCELRNRDTRMSSRKLESSYSGGGSSWRLNRTSSFCRTEFGHWRRGSACSKICSEAPE